MSVLKRNFYFGLRFALLFIPCVLFILPLPVQPQFQKTGLVWFLILYYATLLSFLFLPKLLQLFTLDPLLSRIGALGSILLPGIGILALHQRMFSWSLSIFLWIFLVVTWSIFLSLGPKLRGSGLLSLFLFLGTLIVGEYGLQSLPETVLVKQLASTPDLVRPERTFDVYQKQGYRGKRPCKECPDNLLRIVTLGGSSVYGVPMQTGTLAYSSYLQEFLDERQPNHHFEVLNAGIAGHGITQIYDTLDEVVLKLRPDIVTISSWFNDTSLIPGWYGVPGKSDWEAYQQIKFLRKLSQFPPFQLLHESRSFAALRYLLLELKANFGSGNTEKAPPRPRSSAKEFRQTLERAVELALSHGALPVLLLEARNRPRDLQKALKGNPYYRANLAVAKKFNIPVVDALSELNQHQNSWLFYDFIHPNVEGHRIIAEALYNALFVKPSSERLKELLKKYEIDSLFVDAKHTYRLQVDPELLDEVRFDARRVKETLQTTQIFASLNAGPPLKLGTLNHTWKEFVLPIRSVNDTTPLIDIELYSQPQVESNEAYRIGHSDVFSPTSIRLVSGGKSYGWRGEIHIGGKEVSSNERGYNVALIDSETGRVLSVRTFDFFGASDGSLLTQKLLEFFELSSTESLPVDKPPLVAFVVKTDGANNIDQQAFSRALISLGGTGDLPKPFESFLFVGQKGLAPGQALEKTGPKLLMEEIGKSSANESQLFQLRVNSPTKLMAEPSPS